MKASITLRKNILLCGLAVLFLSTVGVFVVHHRSPGYSKKELDKIQKTIVKFKKVKQKTKVVAQKNKDTKNNLSNKKKSNKQESSNISHNINSSGAQRMIASVVPETKLNSRTHLAMDGWNNAHEQLQLSEENKIDDPAGASEFETQSIEKELSGL